MATDSNIKKSNGRTLFTYASMLKIQSRSTQKLFQAMLSNIKSFGEIDMEAILRYDEDKIYDILQRWVIWNVKRGITTSSILCYFNHARSYLWYRGVKLDWKDIHQNLKFSQTLYEYKTPITQDKISKILDVSETEFKFQLLGLISSGMRISELGSIRPTHLDMTDYNIIVRIPAEITKTGRSRITFFSKQVSEMIRKMDIDRSVPVFGGSRNREQFVNLVLKRFGVARKKADLIEKYSYCKQNRYHVHLHGLRAYFITKANKTQFGIGHILAGHGFYMKEYNQYTIDELLSMYKQFEKDLMFE